MSRLPPGKDPDDSGASVGVHLGGRNSRDGAQRRHQAMDVVFRFLTGRHSPTTGPADSGVWIGVGDAVAEKQDLEAVGEHLRRLRMGLRQQAHQHHHVAEEQADIATPHRRQHLSNGFTGNGNIVAGSGCMAAMQPDPVEPSAGGEAARGLGRRGRRPDENPGFAVDVASLDFSQNGLEIHGFQPC